jgi:hypothetical protein
MPLTRYYNADMGFLPFLTAFAQEHRQVETAENMAEDRNTQQLYGALGEGVGGGVQAYAQRRGGLQDMAMAQQNRLALQSAHARAAQQLEQQQTAGNIYQAGALDYLKDYGSLPPMTPASIEGAFGNMATQGTPELDAYQASQVGQPGGPTGPPQEGVPLPSISPEMTSAYQRARDDVHQIQSAYDKIQANPNLSPEHRQSAIATLAPHMARAKQIEQRYPQRREPTAQ